MSRPLRVLLVEDSENDAILQIETLKGSGFDPLWKRVETRDELIAALEEEWEVVFSVCTLPGLTGEAALDLVRQKHGDLPFVLVSGTVGEEIAAELMRCGANDFIPKSKLWRLVPVVERELRDAHARRADRNAQAALLESERKYRSVVEQAFDGIAVIDRTGAFLEANRSTLAMTGYGEEEIRACALKDLIDPDDLRAAPLALEPDRRESVLTRRTLIRKDGSRLPAEISRTGLDDGRVLLILRDASRQVETETMLRRREEHQRAMAELGREIARGASNVKLMERAAGLVEQALDVESCRIAEWNPDARDCTLGEGHMGAVFAADGPVGFGTDHETRSGFHMGIGTADHPLAIVEIRSPLPHVINEDDARFLRSLCDVLGSALEQKRSEGAMRRSEERFRRYFELGLVGMASTSPETNCFDVNDRLCEMLGYERSELLHKSWADLTHPEDLDAEMPYYRALMSGQSDGYTIDKRFIRRDGTIVYAAISVGCVRRADRSIDHVVGLVQDLTERKVAENELFRREEEFKALVENSPDVVMRFSRDHRHLYVSPVIERFTGIPASQFIGKTHRELGMPEEICRLFETALTEVFATGEERTVAFTFTGPEGEHFFQDRIVPEFDAAHEVEFALSVTRDITAIHNSEGRFRESEALLATAQRMAHIGSWEMNLETGQRTWSREVFRIMGLPAGDPPPENEVISAIHDADRPAVIRAHEMAIETGEMQRNEHRMTTADGSEHIFSILIEPGRDAEGRTVKLTGTVQDVTALRQAEHSLRQSEQRMRDLIESANDAIITLDGTGKILEVNPAVVRLMHEPAEAIIGRQITYSIHPDHVADVLSGLSTVIATGGIAQIEAPVLTALGNYVQVQASASRQSRKGADAIFVIGRDVTEQRRAESERQALTRQIELLLESTYEGICSADLQGRCTLVNRAAAAMLGYTPAELLGKNLHDLIHHHRADSTPYAVSDCPMTIAAKNGKPARVVNDAFWRRNGTSFPVEIFLSPILDPNGATVGIVASFIDVSERQFLQTELERANRLAGLGRVAATMSHEFNNVLMGIQPFAELLTRSSKEPRVIDAAKRISQSVQRGRRVTEELRGFTRPMEPVRRAVDAHAWLRDCAAEVRRLLPPNVELQIEVAKTPMFIEADRDQITQTVTNIVINARDAIGAAQGRITLAAKFALPGQHFSFGTLPGDERFVHFSMCDDGPGIPAENLARVIEPFFTTKKNGTGLGLAITHQIITLHGGHMFVESKVGSGTVVHLFLPATSLQEEVVGPATAPSDHLRILPSEILLIEDEEAVAAGLSFLLNDEGLKVLIAADGAGAMRVLATEKPQALVVDISLPDCDGFELYERIIAKFGPMPAVFSSGHADHVKLADLGPDADVRLLTKPYDVAALLDELELVCAAAERRKESMLLNAAAM